MYAFIHMAALSGLIIQRLSECSSAFPLSKYAEGRTFLEKDDISPVSAVMHIYLRFA